MSIGAPSQPPARRIRLLANMAPVAAGVFALLTVWLAISTFRGLAQLVTAPSGTGGPVFAAVLLLVVGAVGGVVTGLIAYRLGVQVPRTLRGWDEALAERSRALRGN